MVITTVLVTIIPEPGRQIAAEKRWWIIVYALKRFFKVK
jgi:hypothetical protein